MKKIIFTFLVVALSINMNAATITSNAVTGNWNDVATWSGGVVPTSTDDVTLVAGAVITLTADADCKNITYPNTGLASTSIILAGFTLTSSGVIYIQTPFTGSTTNLLDVGTGRVTCGSLSIYGRNSPDRFSKVDITTGTLTVNGNFMDKSNNNSMNSILNVGAGGTLVLNGYNWDYPFTLVLDATSTVKYTGSVGQPMYISTYANLVVGGGGTLKTPYNSITVNGTLTMDGAIIKLDNSKTLTINNGGSIVPGASNPYSATNMIQTIRGSASSSGIGSFIYKSNTAFNTTFPVGTETAYSPVVINNLAATVAAGASITIKAIAGKPFISSTDYINRQWNIASSGISAITALEGYMSYVDADITGTESNINTTGVFGTTGWTAGGSVTTATNSINLFGTNLNGQWTAAAGLFTAPGSTKYSVIDGNWNATATWNDATIPLATDNVVILNNIKLVICLEQVLIYFVISFSVIG